MFLPYLTFLIILATSCNVPETAREDEAADGLQVKVICENLTNPWELVWGPDGKLWMTERDGRISRVDVATGKVMPLITISEVKSRGEGGLLGMVLHPGFAKSPYVFVAYDYEGEDYKGKIVRYTYNGSTLADPKILIDNIPAAGIHNGCRLLFSPDNKLFITTGDASRQNNPQNTSSLGGKVLRINPDGTIPADNPFPNNPVWSYGHRNPQGLVFANGKLYASEHGPSNDDEINIITKGSNYGWPQVEGFCNERSEKEFCNAHKVHEPIQAWTPTLAVSGTDFYDHPNIAAWKNSLLVATLKDNTLHQLKLDEAGDKVIKENEFFRGRFGRLRDVCVAPDGKVYVCTSNGSNDKILMISSK